MSYSIQVPAKWIKEKYLKPVGLSEDLLREIPIAGYGGGPGLDNRWPMYEKADVENFFNKFRPSDTPPESLSGMKEGIRMDRNSSDDDCLLGIARAVIRKAATSGNDRTPSTWASTVERVEKDMTLQVEPLLVDEKTAASILGVSRRTVFKLEKTGTLTAKRIGKRKLYAVSQLQAFVRGAVA